MVETEELREILQDAYLRNFDYTQVAWRCGTSRCIAGEKLFRDASKAGGDADEAVIELLDKTIPDANTAWHDPYSYAGRYARMCWSLSNQEAGILFSSFSTFPDQFAVLTYLESGKRLDTCDRCLSIQSMRSCVDENCLDFSQKFFPEYTRAITARGSRAIFLK